MSNLPVTNLMQVVIAPEKEEEWGKPVEGDYNALRIKSQSLDMSLSSIESAEIRADRNIPDVVHTSIEANGQIDFELSYGSHDELFAGALFNDWSEALDINLEGDSINIVAETGEIIVGQGGDVLANIKVGQWIKITSEVNNGYYQVVSTSTDRITIKGDDLKDDKPSQLKIRGNFVRNGVTRKSFTIERQHLDIDKYFLFTGMHVSQMSLNFSSEAMLEGSFTFLGKDAALNDESQATSVIPAPTAPNTNSVDNFGELRESGKSQGLIQSLTLEIDNNLRGQKAIANIGLVGVAAGRCRVTGKLEAYFQDSVLYNKFRYGEPLSLDWRLTDNAGNTFIVTLPRCKLSNGSITAGSADEDVMATFDFQAIYDPATQCAIQLDRFENNA